MEATRVEFGYTRTVCGCNDCQTNCRFMPGYLIPSDLDRLLPKADPIDWAERNLLASPGATVMKAGRIFRIPTLVPATKPDGTCVNLSKDGLCQIHAAAPFGCAFFDCDQSNPRYELSAMGLQEIMKSWVALESKADRTGAIVRYDLDVSAPSPYRYAIIWHYLWETGRRQKEPAELRARMQAAMRERGE